MNNDINEKIVHAAPVPPFVRFVASAVPMVFDNSLSYYECLCALWKWMQDNLVGVINHNATVTEYYIDLDLETRALFNQLKTYVDTYFDNLDVQDEINNKLDEMAEAGTLQEIITAYIQSNVAWTFDTVADMKLATNLVDGSYARTLGFHTINDGGGALYRITSTGTANEMDVIAIGSLYANLQILNTVTPEMFGAYGDGTHDDQDTINAALSSDASTVQLMPSRTYMIKGYEVGQPEGSGASQLTAQTGVVIPSNTTLDLNNSTLKVITNARSNYNGITIFTVDNVEVKNGTILGDLSTHTGTAGEWGYGIAIRGGCNNITIRNVKAEKCWGDGINISGLNGDASNVTQNYDIHIIDSVFDNNRRQGMSLSMGNHIVIENTTFSNTGSIANIAPAAGVDIEVGGTLMVVDGVKFINCRFLGNYGAAISILDSESIECISNIDIDGCLFKDNNGYHSVVAGIFVNKAKEVHINNCTFIRGTGNYFRNLFYLGSGCSVTNSKFVNMTITFNAAKLNKHDFKILNNSFYYDDNTIASSYAVQCLSYTGENTGNQLIVKDNIFKVDDSIKGDGISGFISVNKSYGFTMLLCDGNYFQYGSRHIYAECALIASNNNFVASKDQAINLTNNSDYIQIDNNVFEQTSWNTNHAGIIASKTMNNLVLVNNTNYSRLLNTGLSFEPTRIPVRWLQDTPTVLTNENNYLIDNAST